MPLQQKFLSQCYWTVSSACVHMHFYKCTCSCRQACGNPQQMEYWGLLLIILLVLRWLKTVQSKDKSRWINIYKILLYLSSLGKISASLRMCYMDRGTIQLVLLVWMSFIVTTISLSARIVWLTFMFSPMSLEFCDRGKKFTNGKEWWELWSLFNMFQIFSSMESSLTVTSVDTKVSKNRKKKARIYFGKIFFQPFSWSASDLFHGWMHS